MRHATARTLAIIAGLAILAFPILLALFQSHQLSVEAARKQGFLLAGEVLRRAEVSGGQSAAAIETLAARKSTDPCSDANIALMRQIDVSSSYLQTVGAVSNEKLICSSIGRHEPGLDLGPVAYVSATRTRVRPSVELSTAPGTRVAVFERSGYAVVLHHELAIDVFVDNADISLGVFAASNGTRIVGRGQFEEKWTRALGDAREAMKFDGRHLVTIRRSPTFDIASFAAIPVHSIKKDTYAIAWKLVPIGVLIGVLALIPLVFLARRQSSLPTLLRSGFKRNEFFLHYQPILDLATGRCVGAEALIRWRRQDGSLVRPDLFIPVAEESGLIRKMTGRVLALIRADAPRILSTYPKFQFSINLSPEDLRSENMLDELRELLGTSAIGAGNLHVEMTERGIQDTERVRGIVRAIRELGIQVAIDDFGTGFSSLSYLTKFELDFLKIDKTFVESLGTMAATSNVAMHIIEMAKTLNLRMIAEGVETEDQARILRDSGVQFAQGWLYAKAMSPRDLLAYLETHADAQR